MSKAQELHTRMSEKLTEIEAICAEFKYPVIPTLLLRHPQGPDLSIVLSNDDLGIVVLCIAELGDIGEVVEDEREESDV